MSVITTATLCFFHCFSSFLLLLEPQDDCASIAVLLCPCVGGFICGICFAFVCSSSLLLLVAQEGCAYVIVAFMGYLHLYMYFMGSRSYVWLPITIAGLLGSVVSFRLFSQIIYMYL